MREAIMKRKTLHAIFLLALTMLMLFGVVTVNAQGDPPSDDEVNAIAKELYCPVCENIPLDVCPTQACEQWRATIREKLEIGWNDEQIKQYFVDQYGARVLATPPAEGLNLLVYILPPLAFLAGAVVLWRTVRTWRAEAPEPTTKPMAMDDPYMTRIEEELQRRERGEP
jgi:cytochrome c-type biogenesis protein CcmH